MADDKSTPAPSGDDDRDESNGSAESGNEQFPETADGQDAENLIAAEGPDVELSFSDADLSFLDGADGSAGSADSAATGEQTAGVSDEVLAAERLADLQRVTAEYANYRKRTEANREAERERTVGDVIKGLLPVLDDLDRAEKHGDLAEGPFVTIAQKLRSSVERLGLKPFGAVGEVFDPQLHEAIFQQPTPDATGETVADVVETGYYLGGTLLRAAKVVVAVPQNG
jgi:molecular chaperone GrpE